VKFQHGKTMDADDVVATFKRAGRRSRLAGAISVSRRALGRRRCARSDDLTVAFHLDTPNRELPYLTSSTTYQAIILRRTTRTGPSPRRRRRPARSSSFRTRRASGAKYDRFAALVGGTAPLDGVDATFYSDDAALVAALLGGQLDVANRSSSPLVGPSSTVETSPCSGPEARRTDRCRCASTS